MIRTLLAELEMTFPIAGIDNHRELGPGALVRAPKGRPHGGRNTST